MKSASLTLESVPREPYPRGERVPKHPVFSLRVVHRGMDVQTPSVLHAGPAVFVNRGAFAIAHALRLAGVAPGSEVLMPAYHCISMIEPVSWLGARPVFYRIHEDTTADLADIEAKISPKTRALLIPHYFGFAQHLGQLRQLTAAHGIMLIEDCAHAFFGTCDGHPVGSVGDYAVASPWKFFPVVDGGCLVSARHDLSDVRTRCRTPGLRFQLKVAANAIEYALQYDRFGALSSVARVAIHFSNRIAGSTSRDGSQEASFESKAMDSAPSPMVDRMREDWRMTAFSRTVMLRAMRSDTTARRRNNYLKFHSALVDLRSCRPLYRDLSSECVPQVYPLVMEEPERVFPILQNEGVPIIRFGEFLWPGVDAAVCPVSAELSRRVFQFPVHQNLRAEDVDWMIERIRRAVLQA